MDFTHAMPTPSPAQAGDAAGRDEREGDGHERHEGRERHRIQPRLRGIEGRDGGDGDKEVVVLRHGGVGIAVLRHGGGEEIRPLRIHNP